MDRIKYLIILFLLISPTTIYSALEFDGSNDQATISSNASFDTRPFTMAFWIKFISGPSGTGEEVIARMDGDGTDGFHIWISNSSGNVIFEIKNTAAFEFLVFGDIGGTISTGTWYHFAARIYDNGSTAYVYLDGVEAASSNVDETWSFNSQDIEIGDSSCCSNDPSNIVIDDFVWYDADIGASGVEALYSHTKRKYLDVSPGDLVTCHPLDDYADGTAIDTSSFTDICGSHSITGSGSGTGGTARAGEVLSYP